MILPLSKLPDLLSARIAGYDSEMPRSRRERFEDLGLTPNAEVRRLRTAPLGDPVAIEVRGTVLCLRLEDAACIQVRQEKDSSQ